jgi:hypothetical protein
MGIRFPFLQILYPLRIEEEPSSTPVTFDEQVVEALREAAKAMDTDASQLWSLDPYEITLIPLNQVRSLIVLCDSLLNAFDGTRNRSLLDFLIQLRTMCQSAIARGKPLLAVGD